MTREPVNISEVGKQMKAESSGKEAEAKAKEGEKDVWGVTEPWLNCLPWDGEEKSLPLGEQTRIPNFQAADLVRRWEVLDPEEDEGYRVVKRSELQDGDIIIGAQINENSVNKIVDTYGTRFFVAARSDRPGVLMNRAEWRVEFGTDVLELQALKQIRQKMKIGGLKTASLGR